MNWSDPEVGPFENPPPPTHMFILPPANTSYLVINATLGPNGAFIMANGEPPLPGMTDVVSDTNAFHTHSPGYFVSNARVYELPLDPKVQYNISLMSTGLSDWDNHPDPILSSVTFYSSLW